MAFKNPFRSENIVKATGGLWDDKIVAITAANTGIVRLRYKDGSPVLGKDGEPATRNSLVLKGIAENTEMEREETYSAGSLVPTADGEGFIKPDGSIPEGFHENSDMAKFVQFLENSGYPVDSLFDPETGAMKVSLLIGAKLRFKGETRLDKDGKVKKNSKGYDELHFYPVEFIGYVNGKAPAPQAKPVDEGALVEKAQSIVIGLLESNGGTLTRVDMVRKLSSALAGDPDANKVRALIMKDEFHANAPWKRDGSSYSLA